MSEATVFVEYAGVLFTITYRRDRLTDEHRARFLSLVQQAAPKPGEVHGNFADVEYATEIVEDVVVQWNVSDETDQDVPITREGMQSLPFDFPLLVVVTIIRHETPPGWRPTLSA